ncbi:MAG: hypothetical protein Ct9H300mP1_24320 [Planctomycetaceae bacterium]|nr:MAG: hypothetical protein Ct9H300mP1_24320 [Planctomycetaceae bacterium]
MARRIDGPHMVSVPPVEPSPVGEMLVGRDPRMQQLFELVDTVARTRTTVLIQGERARGKTLTARHPDHRTAATGRLSRCRGALSETLLERNCSGTWPGRSPGRAAIGPAVFARPTGDVVPREIDTASRASGEAVAGDPGPGVRAGRWRSDRAG